MVLKESQRLVVEEGLQERQDIKVIQDDLVHLAHLDLKEVQAHLASLEFQVNILWFRNLALLEGCTFKSEG